MIKIINGKKYSTETAQKLASYENTANVRDFNWFCETLYKTLSGLYFIHGEGGPASRYSVQESMYSWSGGERIIPCTLDEAKEWAEEYLDGEKYEEIFGEVEEGEGDEKNNVSFYISRLAQQILDEERAKTGKSKSAIVEELILSLKDKEKIK